jgi:hypothetical protein
LRSFARHRLFSGESQVAPDSILKRLLPSMGIQRYEVFAVLLL